MIPDVELLGLTLVVGAAVVVVRAIPDMTVSSFRETRRLTLPVLVRREIV
jgi:hypothetical protein